MTKKRTIWFSAIFAIALSLAIAFFITRPKNAFSCSCIDSETLIASAPESEIPFSAPHQTAFIYRNGSSAIKLVIHGDKGTLISLDGNRAE